MTNTILLSQNWHYMCIHCVYTLSLYANSFKQSQKSIANLSPAIPILTGVSVWATIVHLAFPMDTSVTNDETAL